MAEKRYYWLKLQKDFFTSKRIKKMRRLPGGDTLTIIYLKMQLLSIETGGVLKYSGLEESFASELALDLDETEENVMLCLSYLASCGLIETSDNISFLLPYVVANTGSEGSSAKRVRDLRDRKKDESLHCNADVTQVKRLCNVESESEKDIEKESIKDAPVEKMLSEMQYYRLDSMYENFKGLLKLIDSRNCSGSIRDPVAYIMKVAKHEGWPERHGT